MKPDDTIMSVDGKTKAGQFQAGIPKPLFAGKLGSTGMRNNYVVSPDGRRFLIIVPVAEAKPEPIIVVVNWPALLKNAGK